MHGTLYLTRRRGIYFFRRRVPKLSTCLPPVMVSLGTTDRNSAHRSCVQLTAHMDRMLEKNAHLTLPEVDAPAFFKAELRAYLDELRNARMIERMDGSLTAERARHHRLEAFVLRSLVEDGLREEMPTERLLQLPIDERPIAARIQATKFREFISPAFNQSVQERAAQLKRPEHLSQHEKLRLRWAAVEARMAAHDAVQTVPLHSSSAARSAAAAMLQTLVDGTDRPTHPTPAEDALGNSGTTQSTEESSVVPGTSGSRQAEPRQLAAPVLTPGVPLIKGRITADSIAQQRDQALQQPEEALFSGEAKDARVERVYGNDLFGVAVRMTRKKKCNAETKNQHLKSVTLFDYITGIQLVTDIRPHHLEIFANAMAKMMPKHYWKSPRQRALTFKELLDDAKTIPDDKIGLEAGTIERHLTTIKSVVEHAEYEGTPVFRTPKVANLVPEDDRTDAEKTAVFTVPDVRRLFAHPLWTGCKNFRDRHKPGNKLFKDHHYWINLLLAHTGARRAEIAGLLVTDVLEEDGIPYIYIRANHLRGLKNKHSKRRIPIHPEVIELGFLEFVATIKSKQQFVLFPAAVPAKIRDACLDLHAPPPPYNPKFGDNLDHVMRECLSRSLDGNPLRYSTKSLRHYVNDTLINARVKDGLTLLVSDIDRRDLLGHKQIDVNTGTYRREEKPLGPLYAAVQLLPRLISGIDLGASA
ncbi:putative phage integrase family protein [Ruegeria lacuscaerulensis ITI-1157]|nr:putative phage integrase family protein [Ruegeria lacuscaerulensis ITI-1157]SHK21884.1 hypothetical protein SAMN05444404_3497 [Ruegeria lacuscaerulensis ITI-1157]